MSKRKTHLDNSHSQARRLVFAAVPSLSLLFPHERTSLHIQRVSRANRKTTPEGPVRPTMRHSSHFSFPLSLFLNIRSWQWAQASRGSPPAWGCPHSLRDPAAHWAALARSQQVLGSKLHTYRGRPPSQFFISLLVRNVTMGN